MIETRRRSTILDIVIALIVLLIAFLFWPNDNKIKQSNSIDRTKTQIKIVYKRLNIREAPSIDSEDLGDVYKDEIYTVLSHIDTDEYNWYQIKTNTDVEGYIASSPDDQYIEIISGYIDRTPPKIDISKEPLVMLNGKNDFDSVTCSDDHSSCSLSYEKENNDTLKFTAVDDDGNQTTRIVKYVTASNLNSELYVNSTNINAKFNKNINDNNIIIYANYKLNQTIENIHKSENYTPIIYFYDEDFNEIQDLSVWFNSEDIAESCINNSDNTLKDAFKNIDLLKGNSLCMTYKFNRDKRIKYIALGFSGVENYDDNYNYLANYFSQYLIIEN